ncbi:MAG: FAD:protein FMN transferase [Candidatus Hydrogenedentes bacterium]|nr:FAD:protein FMN transferase [Candidatus Hydrogenedentota bacterium]
MAAVLSRIYLVALAALQVCFVPAAAGAEASISAPIPQSLPPGYFQTTLSHNAMYAEFQFTIIGKEGGPTERHMAMAAQEAFDAIDRLESRISTWRPGTQASRINYEGAKQPVGVAMDMLNLVERSVDYWKDTDGAFDITVGPLVELWRACKKETRLPTGAELAAAKTLVGSDKLIVLHDDHSVGFKKEGMRLDFGGIAKGLAVDQAADVLRGYGVTCALLDGGSSSMLAMGAPPGQDGWIIQLKHPYNDTTIDEAPIKDEAVSTSGYAHDHFVVDGKKYGHIIDPRTGMPAQGVMYAMVIGPTGTLTEALSKGFFVNGVEWARQYCAKHPTVRAILVPDPAEGSEPKPVRINFTE